MFDHSRLLSTAIDAIRRFAADHPDETFYGFSIDADMLCLNSTGAFAATLQEYQTEYPEYYQSADSIEHLRRNTGDWEYQGFFAFAGEQGFDYDLYNDHYEDPQPDSPYAQAMSELVAGLLASGVFAQLGTTDDFYADWVDHE